MKNKLVAGLLGLVIGIILIIMGLTRNGAPTCDNQEMHPGDLCIVNGKAVSYEAREADAQRTGKIQLGFGGVLILAGGVSLALALRDRRRAAAVPPPTPL